VAKPRSRDSGRFRIYVSDRSGFEFGFLPITSRPNAYTRETGKPVQDLNVKVAPNEFDTPPPSKQPLGGEGDVSNGNVAPNSNFDTPANAYVIPSNSTKIIVSVNSSTSIAWNQEPWNYIVGNLVAQTMSVNPQVVAGAQGQQVTLFGVGSAVTLINGSGLTLHTSQVTIGSGSLLSLIYSQTDNLWHETSRSLLYSDLGRL